MKRLPAVFAFAAMACLSLSAMAQQPAAAPGAAKIAWINLDQAILTCEEGKREFTEVQKFVEKKNQDLEAMRKELDALNNQKSIQGSKLTDEARADLDEQIEAKDTMFQRFQQDTQKEIDNRRVRITNMIGRKMLPVIEKIAKEKGLSAVFFINPSRDAFIDPVLVVTDEIIKAYDQAYPVAGAKAPAAAPAKKP